MGWRQRRCGYLTTQQVVTAPQLAHRCGRTKYVEIGGLSGHTARQMAGDFGSRTDISRLQRVLTADEYRVSVP